MSDMPEIRKADPTGWLLARDNWVIAFFCQVPFPDMAAGARAAFDLWRAAVPADAIKHALVGTTATQPKKVGPKTVAQCLDMLVPAKAAKRPLSAFEIGGPQPFNADYWFQVVGNLDLTLRGEVVKSNLVEARLPTEFVTDRGGDAVAELARGFAAALPYSSGYASPALSFMSDAKMTAAAKVIVPAAFRYPGYDLHHNQNTRYFIRGRVVGARWLTFLGPELVKLLGGRKSLTAALPGVTVEPAGHGLMLRAGAEPELGDTNRRIDTPLLRAVAQVLEPVMFFENTQLEDLFGEDSDRLERWERRFLS
jgi:Protein of unknown function (DUF3396)